MSPLWSQMVQAQTQRPQGLPKVQESILEQATEGEDYQGVTINIMKLEMKGKYVVLTAETKKESVALLEVKLAGDDPVTPKKTRKHKKHQHKKTCDVCGRICLGGVGLGIHKRKAHNLPPVYLADQQRKESFGLGV